MKNCKFYKLKYRKIERNKKNILFQIAILFFLFFAIRGEARQAKDTISRKAYYSKYESLLREINEIRFVGAETFKDEALNTVILSKPTATSLAHKALRYYYDELAQFELSPSFLLRTMRRTLKDMSDEIRYFNKIKSDQDAEILTNFYNIRGFHETKVYYTFLPDSNERKNILTFHISEGPRYAVSAFEILGLDSLPLNIQEEIDRLRAVKPGDFFSEDALLSEAAKVQELLLNSGYYYSKYSFMPVVMDTVAKTDSIAAIFNPGVRQRIKKIEYVENRKGQKVVVEKMKKQQMTFKEGDYYSREKIAESENNLRFLGAFDAVVIDTTREETPDDSTLSLEVFTQYRKQREVHAGLFFNQTTIDRKYNLGLEAQYLHRNAFGAAQVFNPYVRILARDVNEAIVDPARGRYEFQVGLKFGQPLLWTLDNSRISLFANPQWSFQTLNNIFELKRISFPIKFPVKLPDRTYFNSITFEVIFEREEPVNFEDAINSALNEAKTETDTNNILRSFLLYNNLNSFVHGYDSPILTANLFGFTMIADRRDDIFSPRSGEYAVIGVDGWNPFVSIPKIAGVAKFIRGQFAFYKYAGLSRTNVLALKGRIGGIYQFDKGNSYVPTTHQFFAGGANSVRGWASRRLKYEPQPDTTISSDAETFLSDLFGCSFLFEGTVELRTKIVPPKSASPTLADQLSKIGIGTFVDFGNAYHWFASAEDESLSIGEYLEAIAVAAGFGIRYDTPVGPIRVDFAWKVYDPMAADRLIFSRKDGLSDMQFHIALGHAF